MTSTAPETQPPRRRGRRGFILLEALAGGVVVTIMVTVLLGQLAEGQRLVIMGSRDITAKQIAQRQSERLLALGYSGAATVGSTAVPDAVGYTYNVAVTGNTSTMFGTQTTQYKDCVVTVNYTVGKTPRTQSANVRLYFGAPP